MGRATGRALAPARERGDGTRVALGPVTLGARHRGAERRLTECLLIGPARASTSAMRVASRCTMPPSACSGQGRRSRTGAGKVLLEPSFAF
jgi:hypothetical protein